MRAIQVTRLEGPESVELVEVPDASPRDGEVLVEVHAAGVTFPEVLQTRGEYQLKPELPFIPGSEVAGVVAAAPAGAAVKAGDRVAAFPGLGGFAELVAARPLAVFPLPENVSFEAGAALPMNYLTMLFALQRRGRLRAGETVLVQGAAGGIGTAAIQVARALGATAIAVVSTDAKAEVARRAGADEVVPAEGFLDRVRELTGGRGVDVVVDPVGGDRFLDSLRSLAVEGRHLVIGFTGREIPTVRVNRLLLNNIEVVGAGWGAYFMRRPEYLQEEWTELLAMLRAGRLEPVIGHVYPLAEAGRAIADLDERRAAGKVILAVR